MFTYDLTVQLHHTDAYGILFFANQFAYCHDAFQAWMAHIGHPMAPHRGKAEFVAVVVHAESDYAAPIQVGDRLRIGYRVLAIGTTSFTNSYRFRNQHGVEVGRCRIVHVLIDPATSAKMPVAGWMRERLAENQAGDDGDGAEGDPARR